jgi:hypothetical protein
MCFCPSEWNCHPWWPEAVNEAGVCLPLLSCFLLLKRKLCRSDSYPCDQWLISHLKFIGEQSRESRLSPLSCSLSSAYATRAKVTLVKSCNVFHTFAFSRTSGCL